MALLALLRVGFAISFWRKLRLIIFLYVGSVVVLAVIQFLLRFVLHFQV